MFRFSVHGNCFSTIPLAGVVAVAMTILVPSTASAQRQGFNTGPLKPTGSYLADLNTIANLGGDIVRLPCHYWHTGDWGYWLNLADQAQSVCERRDMVLVIAFQMPNEMFNTLQGQNEFVRGWRLFAERFSGRKGRIWYELGNEVHYLGWRDVALRAAQAIRSVDTRHAIAFSPRGETTDPAASFSPLPGVSNQVLTFHFYDWRLDVQAGGVPYPSGARTRDLLRQRLARVADAGRRYGLPVYISEVAILQDHPNAPRFLRDFTSICQELGINLTIHAFREWDGWNYEYNPSAWAVLRSWLAS